MIIVQRSSTADTRTSDFANTSKEELLKASELHIEDVRAGLNFFRELLAQSGVVHDYDKLTDIDSFHADFVTGFKQTGWWDRHRQLNRHHITVPDGIRPNINLIDVLDYVADVVMARAARGAKFPIVLPPELLEKAFYNTVALLEEQVKVAD